MKKGLIFWMCAVLLLVVGMTACDNDDNPEANDVPTVFIMFALRK